MWTIISDKAHSGIGENETSSIDVKNISALDLSKAIIFNFFKKTIYPVNVCFPFYKMEVREIKEKRVKKYYKID